MKLFARDRKTSAGKARGALSRILHNEEGGLIILSLQIFLVMLVSTGIAIDLVRVEERRAVIQNTIDRAALAAASLSQDLDPKAVVLDYLKKADLDYLDVDPKVEEGSFGEWRKVTIEVKDKMPTIFGPLLGVNYLSTSGNSQATESIGNVEISLVLDISGSMNDAVGSSTRVGLLKIAAKNFVSNMFDTVQPPSAPDGRLSISIVPYNQQVTLGSMLGGVFSLSSDHAKSYCADLQLLPTTSIAIDPNTTLQRTMYGDAFDRYEWGNVSWVDNCPLATSSSVLAFSTDETTIKSKIDALSAGGDTAIDIGARWGFGLLDPAARPALDDLVTLGQADSSIQGRPLDYDDGTLDIEDTAMKVMVLMTDGQNTRSYSMKPAYRTGTSPFYSTKSATAFSTADKSSLYYYVSTRSSDPYYRFSDGTWVSALPKTIYPITWPTIWDKGMTLKTVIDTFIYPPRNKAKSSTTAATIYSEMAIQSEYATKDAALLSLCETAKDDDHKITIFTVAVDAPSAGATILKKCATAETYAYDIEADDLTDAFASIASAINALRLTN